MINELQRLLGDEDDVDILIGENQAGFSFGNLRLVTALIEGTFPNYEMVVPQNHDKEAVVSTSAFSEAVRRTRTMTNDKFHSLFGQKPRNAKKDSLSQFHMDIAASIQEVIEEIVLKILSLKKFKFKLFLTFCQTFWNFCKKPNF